MSDAAGRDPIDRDPARLSAGLAVAAGLLTTAAVYLSGALPVAVALCGTAAVAFGGYRGYRRALGAGAALLALGALLAGAFGAGTGTTLAGGVGALLAWDLGENAVSLGRQLGTAADTRDAELVHAVGSVAVLVLSAVVVSLVALVGLGGRPVLALLALLCGGLALAWALR